MLSSQSEMELSTIDEISTTTTFLPKATSQTTPPKPNTTRAAMTETSSKPTFNVNTTKQQNSTLPLQNLTTSFINLVPLSTQKLTASTTLVGLLSTASNLTTLKPQTNYSTVKNVKSSTVSSTQYMFKTFPYTTMPSVLNTKQSSHIITPNNGSQNKLSTKLLNPLSNINSTTPMSTKYPLNPIFSQIPGKTQTFTIIPETEKRNYTFPTEQKSTTQNYKQNVVNEQTVSKPVYHGFNRTITSSTNGTRSGRRRTLFPIEIIPSTTEMSERKSVFTKPTKKMFSTTSSSMKTQRIIFNSPPPSVVFRTPKSNIYLQSTLISSNTTVGTSIKYYTTPIYPKVMKNSTIKEQKSRNDILYHGWNKLNSTVIPVATTRSTLSQEVLTTTQPTTSTSYLSTVLNFDYENVVESTWKSKYKPNNAGKMICKRF